MSTNETTPPPVATDANDLSRTLDRMGASNG